MATGITPFALISRLMFQFVVSTLKRRPPSTALATGITPFRWITSSSSNPFSLKRSRARSTTTLTETDNGTRPPIPPPGEDAVVAAPPLPGPRPRAAQLGRRAPGRTHARSGSPRPVAAARSTAGGTRGSTTAPAEERPATPGRETKPPPDQPRALTNNSNARSPRWSTGRGVGGGRGRRRTVNRCLTFHALSTKFSGSRDR